MQIEKHNNSYIVKLEDGSSCRIWPSRVRVIDASKQTRFGNIRGCRLFVDIMYKRAKTLREFPGMHTLEQR
jgi:hypothetical protein